MCDGVWQCVIGCSDSPHLGEWAYVTVSFFLLLKGKTIVNLPFIFNCIYISCKEHSIVKCMSFFSSGHNPHTKPPAPTPSRHYFVFLRRDSMRNEEIWREIRDYTMTTGHVLGKSMFVKAAIEGLSRRRGKKIRKPSQTRLRCLGPVFRYLGPVYTSRTRV